MQLGFVADREYCTRLLSSSSVVVIMMVVRPCFDYEHVMIRHNSRSHYRVSLCTVFAEG